MPTVSLRDMRQSLDPWVGVSVDHELYYHILIVPIEYNNSRILHVQCHRYQRATGALDVLQTIPVLYPLMGRILRFNTTQYIKVHNIQMTIDILLYPMYTCTCSYCKGVGDLDQWWIQGCLEGSGGRLIGGRPPGGYGGTK